MGIQLEVCVTVRTLALFVCCVLRFSVREGRISCVVCETGLWFLYMQHHRSSSLLTATAICVPTRLNPDCGPHLMTHQFILAPHFKMEQQ